LWPFWFVGVLNLIPGTDPPLVQNVQVQGNNLQEESYNDTSKFILNLNMTVNPNYKIYEY